MSAFYNISSSLRMFLQILLYLGIAAQIVTVILGFFSRLSRHGVNRSLFEIGIAWHLVVLNLCVGLVQINAPMNMVVEPYPALRATSALVPLLGVPLLLSGHQLSDLLAIFCLTLSLPFSDNLLGQQFPYFLIFLSLLLCTRSLVQLLQLYTDIRSSISRFSMKEAFDTFPEGLAFARNHGDNILINRRMREIMKEKGLLPIPRDSGLRRNFRRMIKEERIQARKEGNHIFDLNHLSQALFPEREKKHDKKKAVNKSRSQDLLLTDKTREKARGHRDELQTFSSGERVYRYSDEIFKIGRRDYRQFLVSDITAESRLIMQVQEKNQELQKSNADLEDLISKIEEIETEKETRRMRNRIHDVMGQRLSILHGSLQEMDLKNTPPPDELLTLLEGILNDLHEPTRFDGELRFNNIRNTAEIVGTKLLRQGELPRDPEISRVFLQVLREAVTNAIRHGRAKTVWADFEETAEEVSLSIRNDGSRPEAPFSEGEGIQGMRHKLEEIHGELEIDTSGDFSMKIRVAKVPPA